MKTKTQQRSRKLSPLTVALAGVLSLGVPLMGWAAYAARAEGVVFTMDNAVAGNRIISFDRMADGSLNPGASYSANGRGNGIDLGNQGALAMTDAGNWLLAVNPGSDSVSVFYVVGNKLVRTETEYSGGAMPLSVTVKGDTVYVLNAGSDSLQGFRLTTFGRLEPMANSQRLLSGTDTQAAQVSFNRAGDLVAVTEKATDKILTYTVDGDGLLSAPSTIVSPRPQPFGFEFGRRDQLFVSSAAGDAPGEGSMSSFQVLGNGTARALSPALGNHQTASCWVSVNRKGNYAFVANSNSGDVSTYGIDENGGARLLDATAGDTGGLTTRPHDLALDRSNRFLYTLNRGTDQNNSGITALAVGAGGTLTRIEVQPYRGLHFGTGLVVR